MKKVLAVILILACMTVALCSCSPKAHVYASTNLMDGYTRQQTHGTTTAKVSDLNDFACKLFVNSLDEDKSTLVSPLSVIFALAMTTNGAKGETLAEMESTLGLDVATLNQVMLAYGTEIDKSEELSLANAIWFKDCNDFVVNDDFLQTNANYYNAGAYLAPFDQTTLDDINAFVEEHTKGRIKDILDKIPKDAVMYLVNALAFDGEWQNEFEYTTDGYFTAPNGTVTKNMMYGTATYLADDTCIGVQKNYKGGRYSLVALLPNQSDAIAFAKTLTASKLSELIGSAKGNANLVMPKFSTDFDLEMNGALQRMGIRLAFDGDFADLTGLGTVQPPYNLAISRVLHKTHIEVDKQGTKAGAATVVEINKCTSAGPSDSPKEVVLNRPFVYAIWDNVNNIPVFLGTYLGD